ALLPVEPEPVRDELVSALLHEKEPAEVLLLRDNLTPHAAELRQRLWQAAEQGRAEEGFHALGGLAAFDPASDRWTKAAPGAVERMLSANPLHLGDWVKALRPVRTSLLKPLADVYRTATSPERREVAATVLADYAAEDADVL